MPLAVMPTEAQLFATRASVYDMRYGDSGEAFWHKRGTGKLQVLQNAESRLVRIFALDRKSRRPVANFALLPSMSMVSTSDRLRPAPCACGPASSVSPCRPSNLPPTPGLCCAAGREPRRRLVSCGWPDLTRRLRRTTEASRTAGGVRASRFVARRWQRLGGQGPRLLGREARGSAPRHADQGHSARARVFGGCEIGQGRKRQAPVCPCRPVQVASVWCCGRHGEPFPHCGISLSQRRGCCCCGRALWRGGSGRLGCHDGFSGFFNWLQAPPDVARGIAAPDAGPRGARRAAWRRGR